MNDNGIRQNSNGSFKVITELTRQKTNDKYLKMMHRKMNEYLYTK